VDSLDQEAAIRAMELRIFIKEQLLLAVRGGGERIDWLIDWLID